jgi:hypothetical protein
LQGSNAFASAGAAVPELTPAVAAVGGAVQPLWIDTPDPGGRRQEVFAAPCADDLFAGRSV